MAIRHQFVVVVLGLATLVPAGGAHADQPSAAGTTCGFTTTDDGNNGVLQPGEQFGEIGAGPWAIASLDAATDNPADGTIICSINVNTDSYWDAHKASASSHGIADQGTPFVAYLPPTPISYTVPLYAYVDVYICTEWIDHDSAGDARHLYYDYTRDPTDATGQSSLGFTANRSAARCGLAIRDDGRTTLITSAPRPSQSIDTNTDLRVSCEAAYVTYGAKAGEATAHATGAGQGAQASMSSTSVWRAGSLGTAYFAVASGLGSATARAWNNSGSVSCWA